jgi:hypothetical protein
MNDKIKAHHLQRKAMMYVRQSSACQVTHNHESQQLQYAMRQRLGQLGWNHGEGALDVNWCELTTTRDDGKVVYKNAFATNHRITAANVADIVRDGRALVRWRTKTTTP